MTILLEQAVGRYNNKVKIPMHAAWTSLVWLTQSRTGPAALTYLLDLTRSEALNPPISHQQGMVDMVMVDMHIRAFQQRSTPATAQLAHHRCAAHSTCMTANVAGFQTLHNFRYMSQTLASRPAGADVGAQYGRIIWYTSTE